MEYWVALKNKLKGNSIFLLAILCLFLAGCQEERNSMEETHIEENIVISEAEGINTEIYEMEDKPEEETEHVIEEYSYVDYDYIEQYHEILFHNITESPLDDYDDTVLAKYLKEEIEKDKKLMEAGTGEERPLTIDYHLFDFNDDGLDDYLVCMQGTFWSQEDRNLIRIYVQEQGGALREIFEDYTYPVVGEQPAVAVLSDREEGWHLLAMSGISSLLRYDKESGRYVFCEIGSCIEEDITEDKIHSRITEEEYARRKKMYKEQALCEQGVGIDYDFIEKKHKILTHNICGLPKSGYDNTTLKKYFQEDIEYAKDMYDRGITGSPLTIDYFLFDFNDDGLDDYLVCFNGAGWNGSAGNTIWILIQEGTGVIRRVFYCTVRFHEKFLPYGHDAIAVLDEKTNGYYAFVLPGTNRIIRYDKETERYAFNENE